MASGTKPMENIAMAAQISPSSTQTAIESAEKFHRRVFAAYIIILLFTAIATWLVWRSGNRVQDAIRDDADERMTALKGEVARQQERAAVAERALLELQDRVAWRRLPKENQADIVSRLSRFSGQLVSLWYNVGDHEGALFASDIATLLQMAKWNVFAPASLLSFAGSGRRGGTIIGTGVIVTSTGDEASRNASDAIINELLALGFDSSQSGRIEPRSTLTVFINVEARPEGPQGEAKLRQQKDATR
jgi:hypothetical protein